VDRNPEKFPLFLSKRGLGGVYKFLSSTPPATLFKKEGSLGWRAMTMINGFLNDTFQRPLSDLRISVIDRCNFRCHYCMPQEYSKCHTFLKETEWLRFEEIVRLARLFAELGVSKIRLTGGEPLLRPRFPELVKELKRVPGIKDLAMTTNGSLIGEYVRALKDAGLDRITISLDTLDADLFRRMSGGRGNLDDVLKGIRKAEEADFACIKINVVLQRGGNDNQILDLVRYFKGGKSILRFIEYMDVGNCNRWSIKDVVPSAEALRIIHEYFPVKPARSNYFGEVASRYQFLDGSGEVGFIPSVTQPFCRTCTRARLSTDGRMYMCLFAGEGVDLRTILRGGAPDRNLLAVIRETWEKRADRYSEQRVQLAASSRLPPKVEMFQIGG
jgi:cyclic pyranopterin phosphate synthase